MEAIAYGGWQGDVANEDVLYVGSGARVFVQLGLRQNLSSNP